MKLANFSTTYRSHLIAEAFEGWIKENSKVLDVGCGTGVVGYELKEKFKLKLVGCDIENYLIKKIPFKKIQVSTKLPFKKYTFDYVLFIDMLHHTTFDTQKKLLKEGLRVAKTVILFELKETRIGKVFDYLLNKVHNSHMEIPFTYRTLAGWINLGRQLKVSVKTRSVTKPILYPFTHMALKYQNKQC